MGTTSHQHAILLHEIAEMIRGTVAADLMSDQERLNALDYMRAWVGSHAVRLLDDSRALNEARRTARAEPGAEGQE